MKKEGISRKKSGQLISDLVADVERHIADKLVPTLRAAIVQQLGEPEHGEWSIAVDHTDAQTVNFHCPPSLPAVDHKGMDYITPRVKLELGARGNPWPAEAKVIRRDLTVRWEARGGQLVGKSRPGQ
ncbi:nucleotidyl transferase AbiEii/AbiGii toxin family protein [Mesorhizobium xinjiangense]|uniref:nucleotidyl transferase AbiEii/AbiGii toxin family protein n=1 Tax=Mesorhizobium xinjiangense TaxID=2678685 RepID=UPI0012ED9097|nr:nucleotidyl transferase AbiEii/AbiGii toxin family protein [Mesorhizobium xinjiangense]